MEGVIWGHVKVANAGHGGSNALRAPNTLSCCCLAAAAAPAPAVAAVAAAGLDTVVAGGACRPSAAASVAAPRGCSS